MYRQWWSFSGVAVLVLFTALAVIASWMLWVRLPFQPVTALLWLLAFLGGTIATRLLDAQHSAWEEKHEPV